MQALFVSLYKRFADVLTERLSHVSPDGEALGLQSGSTDAMAVDADEPSAMDAEKENGRHDIRWIFWHEILFQKLILCLFTVSFCSLLAFLSIVLSSLSNGESGRSGYNIGEQEQWCCTTLGYVKAFSRQYASEVDVVPISHLFSPNTYLKGREL